METYLAAAFDLVRLDNRACAVSHDAVCLIETTKQGVRGSLRDNKKTHTIIPNVCEFPSRKTFNSSSCYQPPYLAVQSQCPGVVFRTIKMASPP